MGVVEDWGVTPEDPNAIPAERPSVRGILPGFVSEYRLQRTVLSDSRIHKPVRYDDHDRSRPADFSFEYRGRTFTVEVESLQTKSVRPLDGGFVGNCQVDASDKRSVTPPDGDVLETTCLVAGGFDILAINLFEFRQRWDHAFVRNDDPPRSRFGRYTEDQRRHLLATSVNVRWPLEPPFHDEPWPILEAMVRERRDRGERGA